MNALPGLTRETSLLVFTLAAVIGLVVLIARLKVHSFIALTLASLFVGLSSGLAPGEIVKAFQELKIRGRVPKIRLPYLFGSRLRLRI